LGPVRDALLEDAAAEADQVAADANRDAALLVDGAERDAEREIERANRRGAQSAEVRAAGMIAQARGDAHQAILSARQDVRSRLHDAVHVAAQDLRADIRYQALLDELERLARGQLGADAEIERDPDQQGGIIAVADSRRVDYTLAALANRALDAHADQVAQLWA
jgi:vacuolar-type H+-ATPase subunit E/Vma4